MLCRGVCVRGRGVLSHFFALALSHLVLALSLWRMKKGRPNPLDQASRMLLWPSSRRQITVLQNGPDFAERLVLDLANALFGDSDHLADLLQGFGTGLIAVILQGEALADDGSLHLV